MDPLSVVAIAGMIYAGKVLSEPPIKKENYASQSRPMFPNGSPFASSVGQQDISDAATAHMLSQDSNAQNINRGTITVPGQGPVKQRHRDEIHLGCQYKTFQIARIRGKI